nr:hypothetical protein [Dyella sp. ASV24]
MDAENLKRHAELLAEVINEFKISYSDVNFLSTYGPLIEAIGDALALRITSPRDLGLSRWELESNIRDVPSVAQRLAQFELLLFGFPLPSQTFEEGMGKGTKS